MDSNRDKRFGMGVCSRCGLLGRCAVCFVSENCYAGDEDSEENGRVRKTVVALLVVVR